MAMEDAALASVRAFLDACDASALGLDAQDGGLAVSSGSDGGVALADAQAPLSKPGRRGYSTELQRRKRAELHELREYARELEARLMRLKSIGVAPSSGSGSVRSVAMARLEAEAAAELRRRRRAEATNRKLQAELERCQSLRAAIVRLVEKCQPQRSMDELVGRAPAWPSRSALTIERDPFASQAALAPVDIERQLEAMFRQRDSVFAASAARSSAACWLETNRLADGVEVRSSTASGCAFATAESLVWLTPALATGKERWSAKQLSHDGNSYVRVFVMPLACRQWTEQQIPGVSATVDVPIKVRHFARRFRDSSTGGLLVAMFSVLELPPAAGRAELRFVYEQSWTLATPTALGDGRTGSTVETCYRLGGVGDRGREQRGRPSDEASAMLNSVVRALVQMTRRHRSMVQNWLLEAADEW